MFSNDFHSYFKLLEGNIVTWPEIGDMLHLKTIHAMKTQLLAIGYYRIQRYGNPWASLGDLHMVDFYGFSIS